MPPQNHVKSAQRLADGALLFFCIMLIFALAHIFLGAGIFQPYRGMWKVMWKDGLISESDALYHWGHWARDVLKTDNNVVRKKDDEK